MGKLLTAKCSCKCKLAFNDDDKEVKCPYCGTKHSVAELLAAKANASAVAPVASAAIMGFDNPESGVVFIENFFETYDWTEYKESDEIVLKDIAEVVQNNKIKNGAVAQSWYLDFKSTAVPVLKKFEGLDEKATEMGKNYNPEDDSNSFASFDVYRKVTNALINNKDAIIKQLTAAIKYASKYNLDQAMIAEMRAELADITSKLDALKEIKEINQVPAYLAAQKVIDEQKAKVFAEKGIDAKSVYEQAVLLFNADSANKSTALKMFESIRGYGDSAKYIKKINKYFGYFNEMYNFGGKFYMFKLENFTLPALNVANLGKKKGKDKKAKDQPAEAQETSVKALSLYEIVDGICEAKPLLKGIEQVIDHYGNKLYYFKQNQGIFYFDLATKEEVCVDAGKSSDYKNGKNFEIKLVLDGKAIAVKKKLKPIEKKGCALFKKGKKEEDKLLNNFSLILVDLMTATTKVAIPEMVDIALPYDKEMFYIFAERLQKAPKKKKKNVVSALEEEPDFKTNLMVCDLNTLECKSILGEDCDIHDVVDGKIIYSLWKPNKYNKDLHVYDIATAEDILIEDNIYNFFKVINGKIYYTIGNVDYRPLVCKDIDGTNRKEIMRNVENIVAVKAGWLYVLKGSGLNIIVVKVSADGEKRIVICTQLKKVVKVTSTHIYYVDIWNNMRVVRTDGQEDKVIADSVGKFFVVADDCIYYTRTEAVSNGESALSLYKMDKDGNNARKLVFNIQSVKDYDENRLFYKKAENVRFKVTVPVGKGKTEEHYENHFVKRYFEFDKVAESSKIVLTIGLPKGKNTFKAGCFGKKATADVIYEEAPAKCGFKYKGLAAVGEVEEESEAPKAKPADAPAPVNNSLVGKAKGKFNALLGKIKK